jgi:DNA-3-methyladenine glycosylase II
LAAVLADASTSSFRITFGRPVDLPASLRMFGRWGDDGLDRWNGQTLLRTVRLGDAVVPFAAEAGGTVGEPRLDVVTRQIGSVGTHEMERAIRATFVVEQPGLKRLVDADSAVARLAVQYPAIVPVLVPDPFTALIRSISAQQVNLAWASTIRRRLAEAYGTRHQVGDAYVFSLEPGPLAAASVEELRALQLTTAKSISVIDSARAAQAGELDAHRLAALEDEELIAHLIRLRGIGRWSAEWFLARTLGRPRVVAGDLGVRKAIGRLYATPTLPSEDEVRRLTDHWGDAATVVQALALYDLAESPPAA